MYVGRLILNRKRNQIAILVEIFLHIEIFLHVWPPGYFLDDGSLSAPLSESVSSFIAK